MKKSLNELMKSSTNAVSAAGTSVALTAEASSTAIKSGVQKVGSSAGAISRTAAVVIGGAAGKTANYLGAARSSAVVKATKGYSTFRQGVTTAGESTVAASKTAGRAIGAASESTGKAIGKAAVLVGDLNGDGKVDYEDAKIATAKAGEIGLATATEVGKVGKSALQSDMVKEAAAGAIVGAALCSVIPFVGTGTGAAVGGALAAYKNLCKK